MKRELRKRLAVECPLTRKAEFVENCKKCGYFMYSAIYLNCKYEEPDMRCGP